ncbi:MAG: hypothetical protein IJV97_05250 [Alphaproteobacteria bacterium]|nr:hypothetical protein [Alphaproteobacteria bacterium]
MALAYFFMNNIKIHKDMAKKFFYIIVAITMIGCTSNTSNDVFISEKDTLPYKACFGKKTTVDTVGFIVAIGEEKLDKPCPIVKNHYHVASELRCYKSKDSDDIVKRDTTWMEVSNDVFHRHYIVDEASYYDISDNVYEIIICIE